MNEWDMFDLRNAGYVQPMTEVEELWTKWWKSLGANPQPTGFDTFAAGYAAAHKEQRSEEENLAAGLNQIATESAIRELVNLVNTSQRLCTCINSKFVLDADKVIAFLRAPTPPAIDNAQIGTDTSEFLACLVNLTWARALDLPSMQVPTAIANDLIWTAQARFPQVHIPPEGANHG